MPVTGIKSYWESGNLIFTEKVVGNGAIFQFGVDDDGLDVKFFGATSGAYMLWDESADALKFVGGAYLSSAGAILPATNDGAALGSATVSWSDLFLASGGVINWNNGDVTMTHAANALTLAGGDMNFGVDGTGVDVKFFGDTASCYALWDQSEDQFLVVQTNAATSGTERALDVSQTHTGVGANAEAFRAVLTSDVALGSYGNAIFGKIDLQTTGLVGGLIGVVCAELTMPGGTIAGGSGTYSCFEAEINCPTSYDSTVPIHVFQVNAWGAAVGKFDDYGYLFDLTGVSSDAAHIWYDNQKAAPAVEEFVRVKTPSGVRYLALYDANA